jgi:hypothetical protein
VKYILFLSTLLAFNTHLSYSQHQIISIIDNDTKKSIPFANISFGKTDGIYTTVKGLFDLQLITSDSLSISSLGYKTLKILKTEIKNKTVLLKRDNIKLKEIIVSNKKKKFKIKKQKPVNDKDFLNSYKNSIGTEIACFIPNNHGTKDVIIKTILIPTYNKTMTTDLGKQILKRHPFKTIYKVSILENNNGFPGNEIKTEFITIVFDEKTDTTKLVLENQNIYIPQEGCFVAFLNLGPADENGNLIPTSPYYERKTSKGVLRFNKPIKPYFPVNFKINENKTFLKHTFNENKMWKPLYFRKGRTSEFHNISIGYELQVFEY